jgi:predicted MFS family arabinose efflux permease
VVTPVRELGAPLRHRDFRLLWFAQVASELGDWAGRLALAVLIQERTGSAALTALVTTVSLLPYIGLGQWLATLADRYPRRPIIVFSDLARAALFAAMVIPQPIWSLFALALAGAILTPLFEAARNSLTIHTVPRAEYGDAIALANLTFELGLLVGYAAGGGLASAFGPRTALLINACSFIVSALLLRQMSVGSASAAADDEPPPRVKDGWRVVAGDPFVRRFLLTYGVIGACAIVGEALVVPYAVNELDGGPGQAGLLAAAIPCGAIVATILSRSRGNDTKKLRRASLVALVGAVTAIVFFAMGPSSPLVLVPFAAVGAMLASRVPANEVAGLRIPDRVRGSAFMIIQGFLLGGRAAAAALGGVLARWIGIRSTLVLFLGVAALVSAWGSTLPPFEGRHATRVKRRAPGANPARSRSIRPMAFEADVRSHELPRDD